ncbi:PepSY domain-containing protein [Seonamhaeicola sp. NFXS20]|uniref:PepSY domain-containing protein n=1 Tax=Seonamhaeicola sp. NFXS20 TaxID=2816959 RepID=UPI003B8C4190
MTLSIWRYSHFLLATVTAIFLFLASVTGAILAIQPISEIANSNASYNIHKVTVAQTLIALQNKYNEVLDIEVLPSKSVKASVITKEGRNSNIYVNPITGKNLGEIKKTAPIFKWTTSFHRSLFLKNTGRIFVGLVSFLLCFITITGLVLVVKRQGNILKLFSKVKENKFNVKYHVVLSRWFLIPILIISTTGVYLSAEKLSLLPKSSIQHNYDINPKSSYKKKDVSEFTILKKTPLDHLRKLTFPFSDDAEDYFEIALKNKEILVHQYSGVIVSEKPYPLVQLASNFSLKLHTGQGSIIWSLLLFLTSLSIIFFIYSGISMSIERIKKSRVKLKKFNKDECEIILLVGSETGNTYLFAKDFARALIKTGKKVFLSSLNNYSTYQKANHLIVFTATYGDGDAPNNAKYFETAVKKISPLNSINFSVVGFGSKLYKHYCHFAIKTNDLLHKTPKLNPFLPLVKINEQSISDFETWVKQWSKEAKIDLKFKHSKKKHKRYKFKVLERTNLNVDNTFLLKLKPNKQLKFKSGDLLSITPKSETKERLYSIGKIDNNLVMSIKKHNKGKCSSELSELNYNNMITATIKQNSKFHFPKEANEVILIANGTGIAPFLGMLNEEKHHNTKTYLFWGGRTKQSFKLYTNIIDKAFYNKKLSGLFVSFSREESKKKYVQNALIEKEDLVCRVLKNNGVIMICGSIAMKNDVLKTLNIITQQHLNCSISKYENNNKILTDCY